MTASTNSAFVKIDNALGQYYNTLNVDDYFNADHKGKFLCYCEENQLDVDDILNELDNDISEEDDEYGALFCGFDNNFPFSRTINDNKIKQQKIHYIVKYCYKYGYPPKSDLTDDIAQELQDLGIDDQGLLDLDNIESNADEFIQRRNMRRNIRRNREEGNCGIDECEWQHHDTIPTHQLDPDVLNLSVSDMEHIKKWHPKLYWKIEIQKEKSDDVIDEKSGTKGDIINYSEQKNSSSDGVIVKIDNALGEYYKSLNVDDYFDDHHKGTFLRYCEQNQLNSADIVDALRHDVLTIDVYQDLPCDFDANFPFSDTINDNKIKQQKIYYIVKYCYKYGYPPKSDLSDVLQELQDLGMDEEAVLDMDNIEVNMDELAKIRNMRRNIGGNREEYCNIDECEWQHHDTIPTNQLDPENLNLSASDMEHIKKWHHKLHWKIEIQKEKSADEIKQKSRTNIDIINDSEQQKWHPQLHWKLATTTSSHSQKEILQSVSETALLTKEPLNKQKTFDNFIPPNCTIKPEEMHNRKHNGYKIFNNIVSHNSTHVEQLLLKPANWNIINDCIYQNMNDKKHHQKIYMLNKLQTAAFNCIQPEHKHRNITLYSKQHGYREFLLGLGFKPGIRENKYVLLNP
eukprot:63909_1